MMLVLLNVLEVDDAVVLANFLHEETNGLLRIDTLLDYHDPFELLLNETLQGLKLVVFLDHVVVDTQVHGLHMGALHFIVYGLLVEPRRVAEDLAQLIRKCLRLLLELALLELFDLLLVQLVVGVLRLSGSILIHGK